MRSGINVAEEWRERRGPRLAERVSSEIQAAQDWLERWGAFRRWWSGIPVRSDVYNDRFLARFDADLRHVREELKVAEEHGYRGEIVLAAEEGGLEVWPESEDWDDGYIWFRHPETRVLFPFCLLWVHMPEQRHPWRISHQYRLNQWVLQRHPLEDVSQDRAWQYLTAGLTCATTKVGPSFELTNRLLVYHGGYRQRPNALYAPCIEQVRQHAATTPPPVPVPLL